MLNVKSIIHTFAEAESGNHGVEIDIFIFQVLLDRFLAKPNTEFFSDFFFNSNLFHRNPMQIHVFQ